MAVTSIWKINDKFAKVIKYTTNGKKTKNENYQNRDISYYDLHRAVDYIKADYKTEQQYFVTGINCDKDSAFEEMTDTKKFFHKENGILGFHSIQAFAEGEVTPEIAHEIGVKFANEMWGDRFQVVVSTHLNTKHIHNHIVINSVSFKDGKRYYDNHTNYAIMRHLSDEICKEYGLSVIKEKTTKKNMNYDNFYKKAMSKDNYSKNAQRDIDLAIRQSYSYNDFLFLMKKLDYEVMVRAGKISVRKNGYKRNIRIERRFGDAYTIDNIRHRILTEQAVRVPFIENVYNYRKIKFPFKKRHKRAKAKGIIALYYHYCYLLKVFPTIPQQKLPESIKADVLKMEEISNQAHFLVKHKIKTIDELIEYEESIKKEINELSANREKLWSKRKSNDVDKNEISEEIQTITNRLEDFRKEVDICDEIKIRSVTIDKNLNELDIQEDKEIESKSKRKEDRKKGKE